MTAMSVVHAMASQALLESYQYLWLRFFIMLLLIVNIIIKTCWDSAFIVVDFIKNSLMILVHTLNRMAMNTFYYNSLLQDYNH